MSPEDETELLDEHAQGIELSNIPNLVIIQAYITNA
jgi:hypothetical protein